MRKLISIVFCLIALLGGTSASYAQEVSVAEGEATVEKKVRREGYEYEIQGRRDPFLSILAAAAAAKEEKEKGIIPLEDYDVSQIRVIAIVWDEGSRYALIQLPDGKHYTIIEGMIIGIHGGKVENILEDAVLVREFKPDFRGVMSAQDSFLRLR